MPENPSVTDSRFCLVAVTEQVTGSETCGKYVWWASKWWPRYELPSFTYSLPLTPSTFLFVHMYRRPKGLAHSANDAMSATCPPPYGEWGCPERRRRCLGRGRSFPKALVRRHDAVAPYSRFFGRRPGRPPSLSEPFLTQPPAPPPASAPPDWFWVRIP